MPVTLTDILEASVNIAQLRNELADRIPELRGMSIREIAQNPELLKRLLREARETADE